MSSQIDESPFVKNSFLRLSKLIHRINLSADCNDNLTSLVDRHGSVNRQIEKSDDNYSRRTNGRFVRPPKIRTAYSDRYSSVNKTDSCFNVDQSLGRENSALPTDSTDRVNNTSNSLTSIHRSMYFKVDRSSNLREKYNIPPPFERQWFRRPRYVPQERPIYGQTSEDSTWSIVSLEIQRCSILNVFICLNLFCFDLNKTKTKVEINILRQSTETKIFSTRDDRTEKLYQDSFDDHINYLRTSFSAGFLIKQENRIIRVSFWKSYWKITRSVVLGLNFHRHVNLFFDSSRSAREKRTTKKFSCLVMIYKGFFSIFTKPMKKIEVWNSVEIIKITFDNPECGQDDANQCKP